MICLVRLAIQFPICGFFAEEGPFPPTEMSTQMVAQTQVQQEIVPSAAVLVQAAKLAMAQDKPIQLDYYADTVNMKAFMGEDGETKEKMLVKSSDEFTSMIQKVYKVAEDYIVMTENSIYIVSGKIQKRRIQANTLRND